MSPEKFSTLVRRQQIVEAAIAIINTQGLRALSVAAVAERVAAIIWHMSAGRFDLDRQAESAWRLFAYSIQPASVTGSS